MRINRRSFLTTSAAGVGSLTVHNVFPPSLLGQDIRIPPTPPINANITKAYQAGGASTVSALHANTTTASGLAAFLNAHNTFWADAGSNGTVAFLNSGLAGQVSAIQAFDPATFDVSTILPAAQNWGPAITSKDLQNAISTLTGNWQPTATGFAENGIGPLITDFTDAIQQVITELESGNAVVHEGRISFKRPPSPRLKRVFCWALLYAGIAAILAIFVPELVLLTIIIDGAEILLTGGGLFGLLAAIWGLLALFDC